jgi:hypothetical protein
MSKHSKLSAIATFAKILGLPETATEDEISTAFKASKGGNPDLTALTTKLADAETRLSRFESANAEALKLAKTSEINALVAEASRDGKVIPLTDVQLSKMDVADIKEMIQKLPKTVQLSRKPVLAAKTADGKQITNRRSPEFKEFAASRLAQGARELGETILKQSGGINN